MEIDKIERYVLFFGFIKLVIMRAVIQRVLEASVFIDAKKKAAINKGLLILLGIEHCDEAEDIDWLVKKIVNLRIFNDENGVMNQSLLEVRGELLVVSQFTLHAKTKKGNRPSYINAAGPDKAIPLYELFVNKAELAIGCKIETGVFGADMQVGLVNDGPVTIIMDTKLKE